MISVGIDPSLTCTGIAVIDRGTITTCRARTHDNGSGVLDRRLRIREAVARTLTFIPPRVDVSVIEVPNAQHQFGALRERIAVYYFLVDQLAVRGPVVEVGPKQRAKLAAGNGNADKKTVLAAMRATYPDERIPDDNVADALALAAAGAAWLGHPTQTYTTKQNEAHAAIAWPTTH